MIQHNILFIVCKKKISTLFDFNFKCLLSFVVIINFEFLDTHHRFTAEESDWGFTRFYDLRKLFVPSDNRTRALIENDSTNITAFVRVLKDPTGVLWHNFIKYIYYLLYFYSSKLDPQIFYFVMAFNIFGINLFI